MNETQNKGYTGRGWTKAERIAERLANEIEGSSFNVGDRLASVRSLGRRFRVSVRTVHLALDILEKRGYIARRQGHGTRILAKDRPFSLTDSAVLCIEAEGHIFGEVAAALARGLRRLHMVPVMADIGGREDEEKRRIVRRTAASGAPFFLAHVNAYFPSEEFLAPVFQNLTVIGIMDWCTGHLADRAHRVVVDHEKGGETAARYLWERGHRHVVVAGTETQLRQVEGEPRIPSGVGGAFARFWRTCGGRISLVRVHVPPEGEPAADGDRLLALWSDPTPPTALFGLMDAAAWGCQALLGAMGERLREHVEVLGYGNTPWSQRGHPPFSSLDWRIETIVQETLAIIERVREGREQSLQVKAIAPSLVLRTREREKKRTMTAKP